MTQPTFDGLAAAYEQFMRTDGPAERNEAGRDLIRAIFGENAIAVVEVP